MAKKYTTEENIQRAFEAYLNSYDKIFNREYANTTSAIYEPRGTKTPTGYKVNEDFAATLEAIKWEQKAKYGKTTNYAKLGKLIASKELLPGGKGMAIRLKAMLTEAGIDTSKMKIDSIRKMTGKERAKWMKDMGIENSEWYKTMSPEERADRYNAVYGDSP